MLPITNPLHVSGLRASLSSRRYQSWRACGNLLQLLIAARRRRITARRDQRRRPSVAVPNYSGRPHQWALSAGHRF